MPGSARQRPSRRAQGDPSPLHQDSQHSQPAHLGCELSSAYSSPPLQYSSRKCRCVSVGASGSEGQCKCRAV